MKLHPVLVVRRRPSASQHRRRPYLILNPGYHSIFPDLFIVYEIKVLLPSQTRCWIDIEAGHMTGRVVDPFVRPMAAAAD